MSMVLVSLMDGPPALRMGRPTTPGAARPCPPLQPSCSTPSCLSPSRTATGVGNRHGLAIAPLATRMTRWSKARGDRVFEPRHQEQSVCLKLEAGSMASPSVKGHPAGTGALKNRPPSIGRSRGGWTTKLPKGAAAARPALPLLALAGPSPRRPRRPSVAMSPWSATRSSFAGHGPGIRRRQVQATGLGTGG